MCHVTSVKRSAQVVFAPGRVLQNSSKEEKKGPKTLLVGPGNSLVRGGCRNGSGVRECVKTKRPDVPHEVHEDNRMASQGERGGPRVQARRGSGGRKKNPKVVV